MIILFKKTTFLLLFLCCIYNLKCQTNFIPGFIITNKNDILPVLVDCGNEIRNSKRCVFIENADAPAKEFLPLSIIGYRFIDGKFYVSKNIPDKGQETLVVDSTTSSTEWRDVPYIGSQWGTNLDLGIDYHCTAFVVPFFSLGFKRASNYFNHLDYNRLKTINLHVGIYF